MTFKDPVESGMFQDPLESRGFNDPLHADPSFLEQLGVALKQGFIAPENWAIRAGSGLAGGIASALGMDAKRDKIFQKMEEDVKANQQWANPNNITPGVIPTIIGSIPSLPLQMAGMPLAPFETGQEMIQRGEPMKNAQAGQVVTGALNAAGMILPASVGSNLAMRLTTGAVGNMAQTAAQKGILGALSTT